MCYNRSVTESARAARAKAPTPKAEPVATEPPPAAPPPLPEVGNQQPKMVVRPSEPVKPPTSAVNQAAEAKKAAADSRPSPGPADLGRGGKQHQAVQMRLKESASALGFRVVIEKSVLDGAGTVDLVLERSGLAIACEVTVTNTIDYEVGNVARCIKAGFKEIVVVGVNEDKLQKLEAAVRNSLGADVAVMVRYFLPDAFLDYLGKLPLPDASGPKTKTVRGYKVKTVYGQASPEETKSKEDEMIRLMAEMMRRKT